MRWLFIARRRPASPVARIIPLRNAIRGRVMGGFAIERGDGVGVEIDAEIEDIARLLERDLLPLQLQTELGAAEGVMAVDGAPAAIDLIEPLRLDLAVRVGLGHLGEEL